MRYEWKGDEFGEEHSLVLCMGTRLTQAKAKTRVSLAGRCLGRNCRPLSSCVVGGMKGWMTRKCMVWACVFPDSWTKKFFQVLPELSQVWAVVEMRCESVILVREAERESIPR